MKISIIPFLILLILLSNCKKDEITLRLKGTIKGSVETSDEFGNRTNDLANILIQLDGSELITFLTDSSGEYEINNIPTGTYNLIVSKEGYGDIQLQGMQIVGGDEPIYFSTSIAKKPSTIIEDLSLEVVNDSVVMKGIVWHNYSVNVSTGKIPQIRYFMHQDENPSVTNYLITEEIDFTGESGTQLTMRLYLNKRIFPSGSKMYIVTYGSNRRRSFYYDILSNKLIYPDLGKASNIASVTIP